MLEKEHPVYLETVAFRNIVRFTGMQLLYLAAVWGVTWAGAFGIAFPFLIVLLIPARQYLMPLVRPPTSRRSRPRAQTLPSSSHVPVLSFYHRRPAKLCQERTNRECHSLAKRWQPR